MSQENVELVRRIYTEALIDRDPKRLFDHFATPEIEYVDPPDDVDPGSRRGRTDVMLAMRRARQSFSEYEHGLQDRSTPAIPSSPPSASTRPLGCGTSPRSFKKKGLTSGHSATARWFASKTVAI